MHVNLSLLSILFLALIIGMWVLLRRFGVINSGSDGKNLPISAPRGSKISRWVEMLMLICVAGIIFVFTATNRSTGGRLLVLDELNPDFVTVNLTVAICAGLGLLLSAVLCFYRRALIAVILASLVLIIYATLLNGIPELLEIMAGEKANERKVVWTINIGGCDVEGAELWVNGIKLGTLPYTTTPEEFKGKVPFWDKPPTEMENEEDRWKIPHYTPRGSSGADLSWKRWATIVMPGEDSKYWDRHRHDDEDEKKRTYYAQVRYNGEWGYSRGGGGGGGGGKYIYHTNTTIGRVRFPEREKRLETLFDKARLADYLVDAEWIEAAETFGEDGVIAIRDIIATEPQMDAVLAQWAQYKYKLDQVVNEQTAWKAFETICDEADGQKAYSTASVAGKAIEILTPMLDPELLANKAIEIIRSTNRYGWYHWKSAGKQNFGYAERPKGLRIGSNRTSSEWRGGGRNALPIHAYVVAQAVWKMDEYLDSQDSVRDNIIEQEVVPEFIAANYNDVNRIALAIHIGSKAMDKFILRQNWRAEGENIPWEDRIHGPSRDINGWLYLLSKLDSPTGEEFRRKNKQLIFKMADSQMEFASTSSAEELEFLFVDLDKGQKSLAYQYWPRFAKLSQKRKYDAIEIQYGYLLKMEPVSTAQMYVDAFRDFHDDYSWVSTAFSNLRLLPEAKKEEVYLALKAALNEDVSNITGWHGSDKNGARDFLLRDLEGVVSKQMLAEKVLNDLHSPKIPNRRNASPESVGLWLANAEPDHPLMGMLAEDENPNLRVLILDASVAHPTPQNRKLLEKLLNDPDTTVKQAAERAMKKLEKLRQMPYEELTSLGITANSHENTKSQNP